ncbi:MAG TPA: glycosyltransferase [Nocardioides sp.]|nr:glycosyltransferase [Nocardioides sp.]
MALVSVVLDPGFDDELRAISLATVENQTLTDWEVVSDLAAASGEYVAFLDAGDSWVPDRLQRLVGLGRPFVADELEGERGNGEKVVFRTPAPDVEPARLVAQREALAALGPVDPALPSAWLLDLLMRHQTSVERVPEIGVRRRFPDRRRALRPPPGDWRGVVLNKHLVDWAALESRVPTTGLTSVLVPTYDDSELTTACVESLLADAAAGGTPVEVIVWDNGSSPAVAAELDRLAGERVQVHHSAENHGFALGNNLALAHATGDVVVFLNNDTTVPPGWLAPLREALTDPDVLGTQPLLLYPSGTIQSAGVAFPTCGGLPHAFLQGFPAEDARAIEALRFHALTGAALALKYADAVALRGFDPVFSNGMEDIDLCHRLAQRRAGHFRVVDRAPVVHRESRTPGRYDKHLANRRIYLDRWQRVVAPRDDAALWATRGLRVVDHEVGPARHGEPPRLRVPRPVLVREVRLQVTEQARLRWAIKNAAPAGPGGERWGDTHFASALAVALRDEGQEVVVDRRPEWDRPTGRHDDVVLVLRGLVEHEPSPEQPALLWVISHPELVTREEVQGYDRVLAAGRPWAEHRAREWGVPIEPLLQATDPERFHPDAATPGTGDAVLFVGNSRRVLRPVVRDALAAGLPLAVYGDLWAGLVPDAVVRARSIPNESLAAAYRSAGVVLNDHHDAMRADGFVSNRLFDAVASGARVITDPVDGLAELFGPSVQVYETPEELRRLATLPDPDSVFGDDASRRAAADRVRTEHSFAARARRLVQITLEARAARTSR